MYVYVFVCLIDQKWLNKDIRKKELANYQKQTENIPKLEESSLNTYYSWLLW